MLALFLILAALVCYWLSRDAWKREDSDSKNPWNPNE